MPIVDRPRRRLFALACIQPGMRVLVIGVGTGDDLRHVPAAATATGIDLSPAMLAHARVRAPDATLLQMDAQRLGFQDNTFDVVVCSYLLSVVADPAEALAEAARVLVPRGSIWILGNFCETAPRLGRRAASRLLTAVGGASLTRSLTAAVGDTPLTISYRERAGPLADVIRLTSHRSREPGRACTVRT